MRRATDGSVELDLGILGGQSQRLAVTVEKDGQVIGTSTLPPPTPEGDKTPLPAHVLEARNTVFSRELWHELQMEARTLLSYDVKQYESCIIYTTERGLKIRLELLSLDALPQRQDRPDNAIAESVHIALHLLLSHAHRRNETMRSTPLPPNRPRGRLQKEYHLLRPVIARMIHLDAINVCTTYIGNLVKSLRKAKIADAKFELLTDPHALLADKSSVAGEHTRGSPSQSLLDNISKPLFFALDLTITPGNRISIIGHTWLTPATTTVYQINLPTTHPGTPNTLLETCPPHRDYPSIPELRCYVDQAVSCALASACQPRLEQAESARQSRPAEALPDAEGYDATYGGFWIKSISETTLSTAAASCPRELILGVTGPTASPQLGAKTIVKTKTQNAEVARHVWGANLASAGDGSGSGEQGLADVCDELVARAYG
ncbi:hypothetical protein IMZ48_40060 [Candidatus Bathyarchaeota archaeon]|nr:hypothetical protein [Candidatus Bathyarchaeota archaeon]